MFTDNDYCCPRGTFDASPCWCPRASCPSRRTMRSASRSWGFPADRGPEGKHLWSRHDCLAQLLMQSHLRSGWQLVERQRAFGWSNSQLVLSVSLFQPTMSGQNPSTFVYKGPTLIGEYPFSILKTPRNSGCRAEIRMGVLNRIGWWNPPWMYANVW